MKQVDPSIYTEEYFVNACGGHKQWQATHGKELPARLQVVFDLAKIRKNMKVIDFGCGRGELSYQIALTGANVLGMDYSKEAIKIAKTLPKPKKGSLKFILNKNLKIPKKSSSIDLIFFIDVLEHLYPKQALQILKEFHRVLKPGGKIILHTAPNRHYYDIGYPYFTRWISMFINPVWKLLFKESLITRKELRTDYEKNMHVNECAIGDVKRILQNIGFDEKTWLSSECQIFRKRDKLRYIILQPEFGPLKQIFSYDILAIATKPK